MRSIAISVIAVTVLLLPNPVFAASKQVQERGAKERAAKERAAKKACLAGDPANGVEILAELYVDTNEITYLFNQGRCFEQNRRYEDAVGRFREYLLKGEARLSAEEQAVAKKRIEACESYLPQSDPRSPLAPETAPVAPVVEPQPAQVAPGPPVLAVVQQPRPPDGKAGSGLRIAGISVVSVGAAALISGVILNLKVNSMASDLEKPDSFNRDTDSSRKNYKTLGWVSYGVGAAGLVGGSLLCFLGWRAGRGAAAAVALVPDLGPGTAGAMLRGAF
jgi:hypothetical protein